MCVPQVTNLVPHVPLCTSKNHAEAGLTFGEHHGQKLRFTESKVATQWQLTIGSLAGVHDT
jgi:hypothetical protein